MPAADENVLVVRRSLFDQLGSFQGLQTQVGPYLEAFLNRENNFFAPRSSAETDPSLKQIIPYVVMCHQGRILHYVRGSKSGEKRLVAKGSIGIGGHINDQDEGLFAFNEQAYQNAVQREVTEELNFEGSYQNRVAALLNDDSNEVGQVHLGVVHIFELDTDQVKPGEKAIAQLGFKSPDELLSMVDSLETWSQIIVKNLRSLLPS